MAQAMNTPVVAVNAVTITRISPPPQYCLAIGVIGVTPELTRSLTWLIGTAMLRPQVPKIQKAATPKSARIVARGIRVRGECVSSATVLMTSKPVYDRTMMISASPMSFAPPIWLGSKGAKLRSP